MHREDSSDEQKSLSVEEAYTQWSATYDQDRNLTRDLDQIVTVRILGEMKARFIIETGCGTGKNTPLLACIGEKVLAFDFSEGMIQRARAKVRALDLDNVTFLVGDITERWPCDDGSADLVVCNLVLEHIAKLDSVFSEAARCLAPKGRFFVCELHPFRQYQGTKANFQQDQERTEITAFVHHLSDFMGAAEINGLLLEKFSEWWHDEDQNKLPRLVSFLFEKEC